MNRSVIKTIKTLKAIKPNPAWSVSTRDILLSQISAQGFEVAPHSLLGAWWVYTSAGLSEVYQYTIGFLFASPRHAFATFTLLFGTAVGLTYASGGSLPGQPLYAIKQTRESLQVAFVSPDERAQLEVDLAERRLKELKEITAGPLSAEAKTAAVESLAQAVTEKLFQATKNLDTIKSSSESKKVARAASSITEKTDSAKLLLSQADTGNLSKAQAESLRTVELKIEDADRKALAVIVEKQVQAGISEDDLSLQLEKKVKATEEELANLAKKVTIAGSAATQGDTSELVEKSDAAKRMLADAKESLGKKNFKIALEKLNLTRDLVLSVSASLRKKGGDADVKEQEVGPQAQ